MLLAGGVLGLAVLGALLTGSPGGGPGPGVLALPMADHVHVVHRGISPGALPRPLQPLVFPPRRRVHILDPRTALNLVQAHESRRRRGSKRPPPYHRGPPRGPPRPPRWKGPPKRRGHGGPKPYAQQATRGSSPAPTRVRYRGSKKSKKSKSAKKSRPQLPTYADGYAEDDDLRLEADEPEPEEDRPRKKVKSSGKQQQQSTYPKGWGPDGGYRVPAPQTPQYPPYGTDEEEPGTGHLDLEERFINQHNQFYRHGYPGDSAETAPTSTQSKRHKPPAAGLYEDEEIELAEAGDDFADGGLNAASSHSSTRHTAYRRPAGKTRYSLQDGALRESEEGGSREHEYSSGSRRPYGKQGRKKQKHGHGQDSKRHQSMYHAKFREPQDDRTLSAANFNYELSGAASETAHTSVHKQHGGNHRPGADDQVGVTDVRTADTNFFRTRKPQYWG